MKPSEKYKQPGKVLIVNPFGLGDVLFTMPLVGAIKKENPSAKVFFLCNERTDSLVAMNKAIDGHFIFNRDQWRSELRSNPFVFLTRFIHWLSMIRKERFDVAFDLSLGREYSFILALLGVKERIGFDYKGRGLYLTKKIPLPHGYSQRPVSKIQSDLLALAGIKIPENHHSLPLEISQKSQEHASWFLKKHGAESPMSVLVIAPGGGRSWGRDAIYKQWAPERFAETANILGRERKLFVLVIGDRDEKALLEATASKLTLPHAVVAGETLSNVCALLARSTAIIANDGGLLHLAHALGTASVGIYGPVDAAVYGPYPPLPKTRVLTAPVTCRPCYQNFRFPACTHDRQCQELISVQDAVRAASEIV